jgi:hypothetical protein
VNFFGEGRTPRLPGVNEKDKQQAGKGNCFILLFLDEALLMCSMKRLNSSFYF